MGGGSGTIQPGAASLAHHGCLFLDQAPEFSRDVQESARLLAYPSWVVLASMSMSVDAKNAFATTSYCMSGLIMKRVPAGDAGPGEPAAPVSR